MYLCENKLNNNKFECQNYFYNQNLQMLIQFRIKIGRYKHAFMLSPLRWTKLKIW